MGPEEQHTRVQPQASSQQAVDCGVQVFSAQQSGDAAAEALSNLGQVEAVSRGLCVHNASQQGCVGGQHNGSPAEQHIVDNLSTYI